jgi:hypothetical protein
MLRLHGLLLLLHMISLLLTVLLSFLESTAAARWALVALLLDFFHVVVNPLAVVLAAFQLALEDVAFIV